jgi:hypothetical protein
LLAKMPFITIFVPLSACFFIESKMNRLYRFGKVHTLMSNCMTGMVSVYFFILFWQKPEKVTETKLMTAEVKAIEQDYAESLRMIGLVTYGAAVVATVVSFINYKLMLKKSWENQSVLTGIYLCKAAMLVAGKDGPLLYTCLLTQMYSFANVINHRCDSKPGATFALHCMFVYFTMHQYFFRGSHRERFNSIQFGKVCPGGIYCGEAFHWVLIIWELLAPYIICLFLLPLVVKARIKDAYAKTKKDDDLIKKVLASKK